MSGARSERPTAATGHMPFPGHRTIAEIDAEKRREKAPQLEEAAA